jgi:hypothetical protein
MFLKQLRICYHVTINERINGSFCYVCYSLHFGMKEFVSVVLCSRTLLKLLKSQSHIAIEVQSVSQSVSKSWCRAPSGAHD